MYKQNKNMMLIHHSNANRNCIIVYLHMCLFVATVAIFDNVPQGQKNVFIPAKKKKKNYLLLRMQSILWHINDKLMECRFWFIDIDINDTLFLLCWVKEERIPASTITTTNFSSHSSYQKKRHENKYLMHNTHAISLNF